MESMHIPDLDVMCRHTIWLRGIHVSFQVEINKLENEKQLCVMMLNVQESICKYQV
jgi:hypothetical protein